ncbi:helix-turn-helix transcriptional regulator [Actomonas aquatica]|uniref:AraC family transcriptional regulator n=1 Tax=Actomonas aquatica TaxID=2866162 RepID=A0ABZ1CFT7_9BACT|nr:AraC family transcriptional regulator [Opitutus sp. WL0086]WRQ90083.1 AraC family transcriptional regulator [Opitutus sp. WL0086]
MDISNTVRRGSTLTKQDLLHGKVPGDFFFRELAERHHGPMAVALGGREYCKGEYSVQRRTYPFTTLEFVAEGAGELRLGDGPVQSLRAGCVFAYGPGMPVSMSTAGKAMTKYFLCLVGNKARRVLEEPVALMGRMQHFGGHAELREIFDLILQEGKEHGPRTEALCWNSFCRLLLKLEQAQLRGEQTRDPQLETFTRCKRLIDAGPERFGSLGELAAVAHVSLPTLHRLFRRYQGVTPYQYLTRRKMNEAAHALIDTDLMVKEVAARVGFDDPLHFSRVFRHVHGVSPQRLRESLRAPGGG